MHTLNNINYLRITKKKQRWDKAWRDNPAFEPWDAIHSKQKQVLWARTKRERYVPSWVETLAAPSLSAVRGHKGKLHLRIPPRFAKQNSHPITQAHLNELLWRIPFACTWKGFWWLQNKSPYIYMCRQGAIWIICENVASFMKIKIPCHKGCVTHSYVIKAVCLWKKSMLYGQTGNHRDLPVNHLVLKT